MWIGTAIISCSTKSLPGSAGNAVRRILKNQKSIPFSRLSKLLTEVRSYGSSVKQTFGHSHFSSALPSAPVSFFLIFRYFPNTPFHGGMTIETAPIALAWQASRMRGLGSVVSM